MGGAGGGGGGGQTWTRIVSADLQTIWDVQREGLENNDARS